MFVNYHKFAINAAIKNKGYKKLPSVFQTGNPVITLTLADRFKMYYR